MSEGNDGDRFSPSDLNRPQCAETRSVPGDLARIPPSWHDVAACGSSALDEIDADNPEGVPICDFPSEDGSLDNSTERFRPTFRPQRQFVPGHHRGTPNNGFASGPPFPTTPKREAPWASYTESQKQQHLELIEKEINVMAQESQVGIGSWRPKWLQRFSSRNWMLLWMCWFCTVQGLLVNGLVPSAISTIERRFQFSTSTIGRIMQFYDFGYVLLCIPVSYFGGRHSKPLVLGLGLGLMAFGSFLFSTPHLFSDAYSSSGESDNGLSVCHAHSTSSASFGNRSDPSYAALHATCPSPENQPGTFRYVFLFCLAHFLHGIGATPLFTIGVSYIDENVGSALSSLYLGVFYAFAIFGPAIGFLASSTFLQYHTDFLQPDRVKAISNIDESDPKWVGAWWIGFQLASVLALLAVFPILSLPKVLPESLKWHRTRLQEETMIGQKKRTPECCGIQSSNKTAVICGSMVQMDEKTATIAIAESMPALQNPKGPLWYSLWLDVRHIPIAIYRILSNGSYMLITLAMAVDGLIIAGASTFMSKYLERQFGVAPSKANMLIGCVMVPMAGIGTMFSGFVVQHFRCAKTIKFCIALLTVSLFLSPMYLIYCDHVELAGVESHYPTEDGFGWTPSSNNYTDYVNPFGSPKLRSQCNGHCQCLASEYHPVCAELASGKQVVFFSPCYAGCDAKYHPTTKEYNNCTCVGKHGISEIQRVKNGFCESKCTGLFGFLVLFAPFCFFAFAVGVPLISVVLRTVDYAERSFALGIQWILVRVIGTIPAPVLFGWMFDVSCIKQHEDPCSGEQGSCMLYQNKLLADLFMTFSVVGQLIAMIFLVCTLLFFSHSMRDDPPPVPKAIDDTTPDEFDPMLTEEGTPVKSKPELV
uniref:Solute carrier organic anion transporter family member n=2 Tax=Steinernema glaseri TaxID=37863 RepID=A0A1I7YCS9_9BILA